MREVYGTQGGGLARKVGNHFVFVEVPNHCRTFKLGDEVPQEWGLTGPFDWDDNLTQIHEAEGN